jgi:PmbA protein
MDNIKSLFSQVDEYTLVVKEKKEYHILLSHDMSRHIVENSSADVSFEIIKDNRRSIVRSDLQNIKESVKNEMENLKYIDEDELDRPHATPTVTDTYTYGSLAKVEEVEKLQVEILDIIKGYKEFIAAEISSFIHDVKTSTTNSYGLNLCVREYYSSISVAIVGEGKSKAMSYYYGLLPDGVQKFKRLLEKEMKEFMPLRVNAEDIPSGRYNIIIKNALAAEIMSKIVEAAFSSEILRDSFLKDKIGSKILPEKVDIIEKPISPNFQARYDMYGEKLSEKYIIQQGVLKTYLINRKDAKRLNLVPTGNSFDFWVDYTNLYVNSTSKYNESFTGILIEDFLALDINASTAELSVSIAGFHIENGQKIRAFRNGVLNLNLLDIGESLEIFDDVYEEGRIFCGSLSLSDIYINGTV